MYYQTIGEAHATGIQILAKELLRACQVLPKDRRHHHLCAACDKLRVLGRRPCPKTTVNSMRSFRYSKTNASRHEGLGVLHDGWYCFPSLCQSSLQKNMKSYNSLLLDQFNKKNGRSDLHSIVLQAGPVSHQEAGFGDTQGVSEAEGMSAAGLISLACRRLVSARLLTFLQAGQEEAGEGGAQCNHALP